MTRNQVKGRIGNGCIRGGTGGDKTGAPFDPPKTNMNISTERETTRTTTRHNETKTNMPHAGGMCGG